VTTVLLAFSTNHFQALTAANTSCYVPSIPAATGALPGATATTAYSTSSSSGRGSGGSSGSNYHQSLPRHFLRANSNPGTGNALPHSAAHSVGVPISNRPTTTTSTTTGRLITSSGSRGLPYSTAISHPSQALNRPHPPQPIRTVSYYSTLSAAQNGAAHSGRVSSAGIYPDTGHDVMQPPRQFDSYYYHPATLNHSQTSVPLYHAPYRQRPNESGLQASHSRTLAAKKPLPGPGVQYNDLPARNSATNARPRSTNGASTEYAALNFNSPKEIDV
jgi:hypothetical protein